MTEFATLYLRGLRHSPSATATFAATLRSLAPVEPQASTGEEVARQSELGVPRR
jgi:hypothetical protein